LRIRMEWDPDPATLKNHGQNPKLIVAKFSKKK
jgi:hypothetical protein